jgi:squalene synthase HpnC
VINSASVDAAFAHCKARVRSHYENFPVGLFVPKERRPYVWALYAFAREADDFSDEPQYEGQRADRLDEWEARLHRAADGRPDHPVFVALAETMSRLDIPKELLLDLLSAFRQDTVKKRYATWDELVDYCRRSANPVGRLVLLVFGYREPALLPLSDAICTGLQLANHWQDLAVDLGKDRIYVPKELLSRHSVVEADLIARRKDGGFEPLMAELVSRARELFAIGRPLCDLVGQDLRFEMRLTWLGGSSILDGIERVGYDIFARRPHHGALGKLALAWRAHRWVP